LQALKANIPTGISNRSELVVSLVSVDGVMLAEARTVLVIGQTAARCFTVGDVVSARLLFRRGADWGFASAALRLAATYDPSELRRLEVQDVAAERNEARKWYERARELGAPEAKERSCQTGQMTVFGIGTSAG
jgi:hypothetical protein